MGKTVNKVILLGNVGPRAARNEGLLLWLRWNGLIFHGRSILVQ